MRDAIARGYAQKKKIKLGLNDPNNLNLEFGSIDQLTMQMFEMNVFEFSCASTLQQVQDLNRLAMQHSNFNDFRKSAERICKLYDETYLRTEYDFAYIASQNAAQYNRQLANAERFPIWEYKTTGDDRVRNSHRQLDGLKMRYDDPVWDSIYPPNGWRCRCYVKTHRSGKTTEGSVAINRLKNTDVSGKSAWERMQEGGFDMNRGKTQHIYQINKDLLKNRFKASTGYKKQGLPDWEDIDTSLLPEIKYINRTKKEAIEWAKKHSQLNDYNKRDLALHPKTAAKHATGKYDTENRKGIIHLIPDIIKTPNEVYLQSDREYMLKYIKYYKSKAIMVVVHVNNGEKPRIASWYVLREDIIIDKRSGILIYKREV